MTAPLAVVLVLGCQGYGGATCPNPAELCVLVGSAERHRVQCIACFARGKARGDHYAVHGQELDTWVEARLTQRVPARAPRVDPTMIMALQALHEPPTPELVVEQPAAVEAVTEAEPVEPVTIEPVIVEPGPVDPVIVEPVIVPASNPDPTPETPVTETRSCKWPACVVEVRGARFCKTHYRQLGTLYGGVTSMTDEQLAAAPAAWEARMATWKARFGVGPAVVSDLERTGANPAPVGPCDERCAESCPGKAAARRRELADECLAAVEALLTREDHWHLPGDAAGSIQAYVSWLHGQVDTMGEARRMALQRAEQLEAELASAVKERRELKADLELAAAGRATAMELRDIDQREIQSVLEDDRLRSGEEQCEAGLLHQVLKARLARLRLDLAMFRDAVRYPVIQITEVDLRRRARLLAESDDLRQRALALGSAS